ncbi:MAG: HNH endonuclease [Synergistaceae bacterium]|nr:HNH endonuclease [Synergistaceae bacterium]
MASYVIAGRNVPNEIREEVLKRDNFTCQYCGRKGEGVELEIDHIIPMTRGGKTDIRNLITACKECNRAKHNKLLSADQLEELAERIKTPAEYLTGLMCDEPEYTENVRVNFLLSKGNHEALLSLVYLKGQTLTAILTDAIEAYIQGYSEEIAKLEETRRKFRSK